MLSKNKTSSINQQVIADKKQSLLCGGMTKKRILIATGIYPPDIGGPATYSKILLEELPKRDIGVMVLSYGERQKNEPSSVRKVSRRIPKGIRHFIYFMKILALGKNADVIFAQDPVSAGLPAALAAFFSRKKFIIKIVGDYAWEQATQRFGVHELPDEFQKRTYGIRVALFRLAQRFVTHSAERVIVPSHYLERIVEGWGVASERIVVIPNAISPIISYYKELARSELGIHGVVLVSAGRLVSWKGFDMLIRVMADLIRELPDIKLFIIGEGPEYETLKLKITDYQLKNEVQLVGALSRDELMKYLQAADAFVLNTGYEGFSHQIREALALGLPVVTTNIGGNPEIIIDGVNGLLVPYNDYKALKQAIVDVISDRSLRQRLGDMARRKEMAYTHNMMINTLLENL